MVRFMWNQVVGSPTGAHAAFRLMFTDAVTIKLVKSQTKQILSKQEMEIRLLAGLESITRSLNSLLERLHHSYYLYLLTASDRFISVDMYCVPIILLLAAVFSIAIWQNYILQEKKLELQKLGSEQEKKIIKRQLTIVIFCKIIYLIGFFLWFFAWVLIYVSFFVHGCCDF
eukprot:TRINITY_DN15212_c0_g1_i4.p5 TRINITY_DN15212_c0_g1~~TRINITY_DN15212_c0_g1_i4.p5  ORF type:complete len:171 (-),score=10.77 TRINITY_DN15212_c0_g1_i4:584-1096(-)